MVVKRTKTGISCRLSLAHREKIFNALINFLEPESVELMKVAPTTESDIKRHLFYLILDEMLTRKHWHLHSTREVNFLITNAEGMALMWLLRSHDENMHMLELKSGLHKLLSK